jgi:hypothetical protein
VTRKTPPARAKRLGNPGHRPQLAVLDGAGWSLPPLPDPPQSLGESGVAAWKLCQSCGWITATDQPVVYLFAQVMDDRAWLRDLIRREPTVTGSRGQQRANPLASDLRHFDKLAVDLARQLGLDPTSRTGLGVTTARSASVLDELQDRRARRRQQEEDSR